MSDKQTRDEVFALFYDLNIIRENIDSMITGLFKNNVNGFYVRGLIAAQSRLEIKLTGLHERLNTEYQVAKAKEPTHDHP